MADTLTLDGLIAVLPADTVVTDPDIIAGYRQDRALDPEAGLPMAVVRARTTDDVVSAVRWCAANRVPIIPRGAGTGLSGGSGGVVGAITISPSGCARSRSIR